MKSALVALAVILSLAAFNRVLPAYAQTSAEVIPTDIHNWCEAGQEWGDGRCSSDDPWLQTYMWKAGWCHGMDDAGLLEGDVEECILTVTGGILVKRSDNSGNGDDDDEEDSNDGDGNDDDGDE